MKYISLVFLVVTVALHGMAPQTGAVAKPSYEQKRADDGMRQLLIGAPCAIAGGFMCYQTFPTESNPKDLYNAFRFSIATMLTAFGVAHLAHSCDNLVCNDDECKAVCIQLFKAVCKCKRD